MSTHFYPVFREYTVAIQEWLRDLFDVPKYSQIEYNIKSITLKGNTEIDGGDDGNTSTNGIDQHEVHLDTDKHELKKNYAIKLYNTTSIKVGSSDRSNDSQYIISAVKGNVIVLDKEYKKLSLEQPLPSGKVRKVVPVMYGEMAESIAKIASPIRNGSVLSPGVSFYLADRQAKEGMRPKENYYTRRYYDNRGNKIGSAAVKPLQEYRLTYSINIWSPYRTLMDMLLFQLQSEFAPEKYFWIPGSGADDVGYGFEYTEGTGNCRYDREHHGQWAHTMLEGVIDASDLEPGSNAQTVYRTEITFTVTNAYMALPFDREQPYIGEITLEQHIEDRLSEI